MNFPCPRTRLIIWSREMGSVVPSRVSLLILHTQAESGAYSRDSSRFPRGVHLFIQTTIRHRASFDLIGSRNCASRLTSSVGTRPWRKIEGSRVKISQVCLRPRCLAGTLCTNTADRDVSRVEIGVQRAVRERAKAVPSPAKMVDTPSWEQRKYETRLPHLGTS